MRRNSEKEIPQPSQHSHNQSVQCRPLQQDGFRWDENTDNIYITNLYQICFCVKGGFSLEAQMDCFSKDVKAFHELSNEDVTTKDFSKFSKLGLPQSVR